MVEHNCDRTLFDIFILGSPKRTTAETNFIKKWILTKPAVISAALFSGAEIVAYPPQGSPSGKLLCETLM